VSACRRARPAAPRLPAWLAGGLCLALWASGAPVALGAGGMGATAADAGAHAGADAGAGADPDADLGANEATALDPAELDALLADLEAQGGILGADERAELVASLERTGAAAAGGAGPQAPGIGGGWSLAVGARDGASPRLTGAVAGRGDRWAARLRTRRQGDARRLAAWARTGAGLWSLAVGDGVLVCGGGLAGAPRGRPRLAADESLRLPAAGWRPSAALEASAPRTAASASVRVGGWQLAAGGALSGAAAGPGPAHVVAGWSGEAGGVLLGLVRQPDGEAHTIDAGLAAGRWRLQVAAARWTLGTGAAGQAWAATGRWRGRRTALALQVASSRAGTALSGARRPACLSGWRGDGWAVQGRAHVGASVQAGLVAGVAYDRDPDAASGRQRQRGVLEAAFAGRFGPAGGAWEVRLRRVQEAWSAWDPDRPWRPAAVSERRDRLWLVARLRSPLGAASEGSLSWRRLEDGGEARQLVALRWSARAGAVTWRAEVQSAWGAPVNLVAVSAAVPGLVRLRPWGRWDQGLLMGLHGGRGAGWRWQLGGEWRRGTGAPAAGADGAAPRVAGRRSWEVLASVGRRF